VKKNAANPTGRTRSQPHLHTALTRASAQYSVWRGRPDIGRITTPSKGGCHWMLGIRVGCNPGQR
jgi:hypothetical protein